ncbi:MAG: Na/Pi cotransporter family protein [Fusobacteria bacterium]|nr:Na/Pi cotransporter family protein [Fusobacteriota bacterium]
MVLSIVLVVIGGLGIFLLGMNYMSNGLQTVAGDKLKWLVNKVANNRVFATIIGTFITVIIQSSSITTVMVVGFVNAGIMTLKQSIGIIMGANIGTTITGWVLIVKIGKFGLPIIGVAALVSLFVKKDKIKYVATIIMGLGMIFFGLQLMTDGFAPIRDIPEFVSWFQIFSATTYFGALKCILLGAVLTMVVQSSSATLGITIGLAITGVIPFQTAAALVLGENIGTTITAYLASLGANTAAKRAAYAHIIFNIFGGVWVFSIFPFYINFIEIIANDSSVGKKIALTHTMFNVLNVLVFLPFVGYFAKFLEKIVPEEKEVSIKLTKLDERMFETPILVIDQSKREIINMGLILQDMFETLREVIVKDYDKNHPQVRKIFNEEAKLDVIQKEISGFLIKVFNTDLSVPNVIKARKYLSLCDEYESISDYIMNISKLRLKLLDNKLNLSEEKKRDMLSMQDKVLEYFNTVNSYFIMDKTNIMPKSIEMNKNTIDYFKKLREMHHERLSQCQVEPLLSTSYMDILNAYRRMKDHIFDITEIISGEKLV